MTSQKQDYAQACEQAAHAQGLTPPTLKLREAGFRPVILQTGGYCMVLEAYSGLGIKVWVTQDGGTESEPTYLVCAYTPGHPEMDGTYVGEKERSATYGVSLQDLPALVRQHAWETFDDAPDS